RLERTDATAFVAAVRGWLATMTDRLFAVDAQQQSLGPDAPDRIETDVAVAFVAHQAIGARLDVMGSPDGLGHVSAWCYQTVTASDGSVVTATLGDACVLLESVIGATETTLARTATDVHETLRVRAAI
ncbi:MAG TPA: hypothetical protein PLV68_11900, partial [Ilumatobacteraceae bacterium]|nr:hypothetical protein [Ilumatobacteraceae bacterium]